MDISRRGFLLGGAAAVGTAGCCGVFGASKPCRYSVSILGDIHFDSTDTRHYHSDYTHSTTRERYEGHLKEHVRNAGMWADRMPRLVAASAKCVAHDAAFAFQMGDLVQGDCGNRDTHRRMLDDAFGLLKKSYGTLPVVVVPGNHDIRGDIEGDGAKETLEKWIPRRMTRELGVEVAGTTFLFWHGPDAYIVVDFNEPSPDFAHLMGLLKRSEGARHTFILSHGPVIPSCTSRWFLLGEKDRTEERRELRAALAKRGAIALSGHTHVLEHYECVFPEGRISQFVFNSVWSRPGAEDMALDGKGTHDAYAIRARSIRNYTPPSVSPKKAARWTDLAELSDEYSPFVKESLAVSTVGHYRMNVSDDCVSVDFFAGDSMSPKRRFELLAGRRGGMI